MIVTDLHDFLVPLSSATRRKKMRRNVGMKEGVRRKGESCRSDGLAEGMKGFEVEDGGGGGGGRRI